MKSTTAPDARNPDHLYEELQTVRRLFSEAQQIGKCGVYTWDLRTNRITWSDEFFRLVGRDPEEFEHSWDGFLSCIHEEDRKHVARTAEQVIVSGVHPSVHYRVVFPDGSIRHIVSKGRLEYDADGEPIRMVGFSQDITQQRIYEDEIVRAREDAERASQAKSEFLAMMSHELRTPLTTILGPCDMLELKLRDDDDQVLLGLIKNSSEQLLMVINDVLNLTKTDAGVLKPHYKRVAVRSLLAHHLAPLRLAAESKGLTVAVTVDDAVPETIVTDNRLLVQVLLNIVGNAVKFTDHGSVSIHISPAVQRPGYLALAVADTGPGIPADEIPHIFEPFHQVDMSLNRMHEGSGLGLAIAANIMALLGGTITTESKVGDGSVFTLVFPISGLEQEEEASSEVPERRATDDGGTIQVKRILVVEDYPGTQFLIRAMLNQLDIPFDLAMTGEEAVERYASQQDGYQVVLMDIRLPGIDGMEATRQIRRIAGEEGQPYVIAQTAYALTHESERIRAAGMDDLLSKPYSFVEFKRAIKQALKR